MTGRWDVRISIVKQKLADRSRPLVTLKRERDTHISSIADIPKVGNDHISYRSEAVRQRGGYIYTLSERPESETASAKNIYPNPSLHPRFLQCVSNKQRQ